MSDHVCLVLTGRGLGEVIKDSRVTPQAVVASAVGFNPAAPSLIRSVVDFTDFLEPEQGGLRCRLNCHDYRIVVWMSIANVCTEVVA